MKKLFLVITLLSATLSAQQRVSIAIYQDAKFLTIGDEKRGYEAGTADLVFRFNMQGKQQKYGYMIVSPEFEYADIEGIYKRYSANVGYVFNQLVVPRTEVGSTIGYGFIDRWGKSMFSFSVSGFINYKITDRFKLSLMAQFTERKDLAWAYGKNDIRFSGLVGLGINL